jgi:flagellar biosynthesis protein
MKTPFEAIALEYGQRKTPRVVAKGQAALARRIIEEAKRQGIYVAEDPQLLALLSKLDVGEGMQPGDEQAQAGDKTASNFGKAP